MKNFKDTKPTDLFLIDGDYYVCSQSEVLDLYHERNKPKVYLTEPEQLKISAKDVLVDAFDDHTGCVENEPEPPFTNEDINELQALINKIINKYDTCIIHHATDEIVF